MKGVIFDISGKFAHFRKFYTNSSSLSYGVPPRTTIMGLIAGIMGIERDTYYQDYNSKNLHIAVNKKTETRSIIQTLNYFNTKSKSQLIKTNEHTQIPFEVIYGIDGLVAYRIYVASENTELIMKINKRIKEQQFVYPPVLGVAPFQGDITYVALDNFIEKKTLEDVLIQSIIPISAIKELKMGEYSLSREKMPKDFGENRKIEEAEAYLIETKGESIQLKLKVPYFKGETTNFNVVFM